MKKTIYMALIESAMMDISAKNPDLVEHEVTPEEMDSAVYQILRGIYYDDRGIDELVAYATEPRTDTDQAKMIVRSVGTCVKLLKNLDSRDYDHDAIRNAVYQCMTLIQTLDGVAPVGYEHLYYDYRCIYHLMVLILDYMAKRDFDERLDLYARMMINRIFLTESDYVRVIEEY